MLWGAPPLVFDLAQMRCLCRYRSCTLLRLCGFEPSGRNGCSATLHPALPATLAFREADQFSIRIISDDFPNTPGRYVRTSCSRHRIAWKRRSRIQTISIALNGRNAIATAGNGQGELTCGPMRIRLFAFDLDGEALAKIAPRIEIRAGFGNGQA